MLGRLFGTVGLGFSLALLWFAVRWGWADWLSKERTRESISAAIRLAPDNWTLDEASAEIWPANSLVALNRAVELNPLNAGLWIELSAAEEKVGDLAGAEAHLVKAVSLDKSSGVWVLLAEWYFRQHKADLFWKAARATFEFARSPAEELLRDCWTLSSDAGFIRSQAIPQRIEILFPYFQFLLAENHIEAARGIAVTLMEQACCSEYGVMSAGAVRGLFSDYVERLARLNQVDEAASVWNWMVMRKLIPYGELGVKSKHWIVDGGFEVAPSTDVASGFSWRPEPSDGVFVDYIAQEHGMKISLSGKQAEHCEILAQNVVLWAGHRYRMKVKYMVSGMQEQTGLRWRVMMPSGEDLLSVHAANKNGAVMGGTQVIAVARDQEFVFATPAKSSIGRLVLEYDRLLGTVRTEGAMEIFNVDGAIE